MGKCLNCGNSSKFISSTLNLCICCIRNEYDKLKGHIENVHREIRKKFQQPEEKQKEGIICNICVNECRIEEGETGYCGIRKNEKGKLKIYDGKLSYYFDPLPTNCVASWICPEKNSSGYFNLAVFYSSCNFNCLFCQNWHYREKLYTFISPEELANSVNRRTKCVCYFGGDPVSQIEHSLKTSEILMQKNPQVRICWETNGSMNKNLVKKISEVSLKSKGCIKFDIKAFEENLNLALSNSSNKNTLENFAYLAEISKDVKDYHFLIASTLLVPGYIDEKEVEKISSFIASLNPEIPYSLLVFYPEFYMKDLPVTPKKSVYDCKRIAEENGLKNVNIGNIHLLL